MSQLLKSVRNQYGKKFGNDKVEWACRKANWHKARAQKMGREVHFSAWQWLDLCENQGWKCAYCKQHQPSLEPHHRHELHKGGFNTIENLDAICRACHEMVHEWPDDVSEAWMTYQNALCEHFKRVALNCGSVRLAYGTREENLTRCRGILLEFHAPKCGKAPLRGILPRGDWKGSEPFAAMNPLTQDWWDGRAAAQVQWHAGGMWEERVFLSHLARVEPSAREKEKGSTQKMRAPQMQLALSF